MPPPRMLAAILVSLGVPAFAGGQTAQPQQRGPSPDQPLSVRVFAEAGMQTFVADDSFEAITGNATGAIVGGGGEVLARRWFVRVGVSRYHAAGERVFLFEDEIFRLGIPLTVTVTPIEASGGHHFRQVWRLVPYVGAGMGSYRYTETSVLAEAENDEDRRHWSAHVLAGAEFVVWGRLSGAAEFQYTRVAAGLGDDGVSDVFDERDLGGFAGRAKLVFRVW